MLLYVLVCCRVLSGVVVFDVAFDVVCCCQFLVAIASLQYVSKGPPQG